MEVVQVIPKDDYKIIVYFVDGHIRKYDVSPFAGKSVFVQLTDIDFYKKIVLF